MTAATTLGAPTPRPNPPAIVSFSNEATSAAPASAPSTPGADRSRPFPPGSTSGRRSVRPATTDYLSDRATAAFIRRVLCSQHLADKGRTTPVPIEELLPPLTSRNDVDLQLYALIAVIMREYVQAWYSKITPDGAFVDEIVQIIAHCTRALEQRLRKVDLESLLFDELPDVLDRHVLAYRAAHDPLCSSPTEVDPREVYHSLYPVAHLSPLPRPEVPDSAAKQQENEAVYRQLLVQGTLAILLPTEDLENDCLTSLVGQIFSELIIGNVLANRLSQPWLIYECLIILTRVLERRVGPVEEGATEASEAGLVNQPRPARRSWSIHGTFWSLVHWSFLAFATMRLLVTALAMSSSLPPRSEVAPDEKHEVAGQISIAKVSNPLASSDGSQPVKTPIVAFKLWTCISDLVEMDTRMPWLSGTLSMLQLGAMTGPGRIASLNGPMDRLISHFIHQRLLDAASLPALLRSIRAALFPNNAPGVSTLAAPSSDEELRVLRRRCANALLDTIPSWLAKFYLGEHGLGLRWRSDPASNAAETAAKEDETAAAAAASAAAPGRDSGSAEGMATGTSDAKGSGDDESCMNPSNEEDDDRQRMLSEIEEGILDIFSDEYCNKHLVYSMLELILVRLMPELAEKGVVELWGERLSL